MDGSRIDTRTVALALLCLAALAFAAATLDTTVDPESGTGLGGGSGDASGDDGTPTADAPGDSDDGTPFPVDLPGSEGIGLFTVCVGWLQQPWVQAGLVLGLVVLFLVGRWYDDEMLGLTIVFLVGYPGFFLYLILTSCTTGPRGLMPDLSRVGSPMSEDSGGLVGGEGSVTSPSFATQLLLVLVVLVLGVVAVAVLTGDHDQLTPEDDAEAAAEDDDVADRRADVTAIGEAAGRAADRIEREGTFENEVYRAWAEMTEPLSVDRPESSTPAEFAEAAVAAGIDRTDADRLTELFEEVRYGGADPTDEREREAVSTLRRIESTYAEEGSEP